MKIVFDLDGTLTDTAHREHFLSETPKNWDAFFAAQINDPINRPIAEIFDALSLAEEHKISIWTGRPFEYFDDTIGWIEEKLGLDLESHVPSAAYATLRNPRTGNLLGLCMRKLEDRRNDTVIKAEWIGLHGRPDLVFEDRTRLVEMYRDFGITCVQVGTGDF
ncbi:MAG: hypothetical protein OXL41_03885 [Nitrospinae bacterium]|nr:hypothetical protein [Nitrospinota bacterium]